MPTRTADPNGAPPPTPAPWLARLTATPGPAVSRHLSRNGADVLVVPGRYSVTYLLLAAEAVAVVDVGSNSDHRRITAALDWLDRPASHVRCVLPTHLHMDHIMGIDRLARGLGVPVMLGRVAHDTVSQRRHARFPRPLHSLRAVPTYVMQGAPRGALSDWRHGLDFGFPWSKNRFRAELSEPVDDGDELPGFAGWRLLHTPGHSDDSVCLFHAEARFLIAGDTVRNFCGGEWNPLLADHGEYAQTQQRLRELDVETILPGHGPPIAGTDVVERLQTRAWYEP